MTVRREVWQLLSMFVRAEAQFRLETGTTEPVKFIMDDATLDDIERYR